MLELFGYSAFFKASGDREKVLADVQHAGQVSELRLIKTEQRKFTQQLFGRKGRPAIGISLDLRGQMSIVSVDAMDRATFESYGPTTFERLLTQVSVAVDATVGRTFSKNAFGALEEREIEEGLDFLDWYQYFGSELVQRWGTERLAEGPFHNIVTLASGACALTLSTEPFEHRMPRRVAANYLGIALRPMIATTPKGKRTVIPWD